MNVIAAGSNHPIDWTHHSDGVELRVEGVAGAVFRHAAFLAIAAASAYVYANTNPYLFVPLSVLGLGSLVRKAAETFDGSICLISVAVKGAFATGAAAYSIFNATSLVWVGALGGGLSLNGLSSILFALSYSIPLLHALLPYRSLLGTEYPLIVRKLDAVSVQFSTNFSLRFSPISWMPFAGITVCCINSRHFFPLLLSVCDGLREDPYFVPCDLLSVFLTDLSLEQVVEFTIRYHGDQRNLTQSFLGKLAERFGDLSVLNAQLQTLKNSLDQQEKRLPDPANVNGTLTSVDIQLGKLRRFLSLLPPHCINPTLQPAVVALSSQLDHVREQIGDEIVSNYDALGAIGFSITDFQQLGQMLSLPGGDLAASPIQVVSQYLAEHELPDQNALVQHKILKNGANSAPLVRRRIVRFYRGFSTINAVVSATMSAACLAFQMLQAPCLTFAAGAIGFWFSGRMAKSRSLFLPGIVYGLKTIHSAFICFSLQRQYPTTLGPLIAFVDTSLLRHAYQELLA